MSIVVVVVVIIIIILFADDPELSKGPSVQPGLGQKMSLANIVYSQHVRVSNVCLPGSSFKILFLTKSDVCREQ